MTDEELYKLATESSKKMLGGEISLAYIDGYIKGWKYIEKVNHGWNRWTDSLPELEPDGLSCYVEVCYKRCLPHIAYWNGKEWRDNKADPLFKKSEKIDKNEVWWRKIEYPSESSVGECMELNAENVDKVFKDCLVAGAKTIEDAIRMGGKRIEGVNIITYFDTAKVESHRKDIKDMLGRLDNKFREGRGDGWSFLNMGVNAEGNQWTSDHKRMDALVCLGLAIGALGFCVPRTIWKLLPGEMPYGKIPYIYLDLEKDET